MASKLNRRVDFIARNLVVVGVRQSIVGDLIYLYLLVTGRSLVYLCAKSITDYVYNNVLFSASTLGRLAAALMAEGDDFQVITFPKSSYTLHDEAISGHFWR